MKMQQEVRVAVQKQKKDYNLISWLKRRLKKAHGIVHFQLKLKSPQKKVYIPSPVPPFIGVVRMLLKLLHSQASAYAHVYAQVFIWLMQEQGRTDASMSLPCHRNHN